MIELKDVRFGFAAGREILRSIRCTIEDGTWISVAGGNGSGKTTLCRLIAGLYRPSAGTISVDGRDPFSEEAPPAVGIAFQDPDSQFVTANVEREILFGMENLHVPTEEMRTRLAETSRFFDLEGLRARNPHTLSGGEKQRVVLASLRAMAPRHLVLDEPFSFLDAVSRGAFLETLRSSFSDGSVTVVWSTVAEEEIALSERVLFMHEGSVIYDGPPDGLTAAVGREILDSAIVRAPPAATGSSNNRSRASAAPAPHEFGGAEIPTLIEMRDAVLGREGGFSLPVPALSIRQGESVGIAGPCGSGKTTLLLGCAGLLPPRAGAVKVLGNRIRSRRDAPVGRFAFLFQSSEEGFFAPTVREEVALAHKAFRDERDIDASIAGAIEAAGLSPAAILDRSPFGLSQGEKRLVAVASLMVIGAPLMLLDEPTLFLDGAGRARLRELIDRLHVGGTTVVIASHDRRLLESSCSRIIELGD